MQGSRGRRFWCRCWCRSDQAAQRLASSTCLRRVGQARPRCGCSPHPPSNDGRREERRQYNPTVSRGACPLVHGPAGAPTSQPNHRGRRCRDVRHHDHGLRDEAGAGAPGYSRQWLRARPSAEHWQSRAGSRPGGRTHHSRWQALPAGKHVSPSLLQAQMRPRMTSRLESSVRL